MLARLIQQKIPIGSQVRFSLKNGQDISGVLLEIARDYVTVENTKGPATILTEMIGAWEILETEGLKPDQERISIKPSEAKQSSNRQPGGASKEQFSPSDDLRSRVLKRLIQIEANFQAHLQTAKIELKIPDFTIPSDEIESWQRTDAATIWNRIKNQYEYAQKINELSAKFGRIQPITNTLKSLTNRFPSSAFLKRHLAYLYFLLGNRQEAIQHYQYTALSSGKACDWFNVAVIALGSGEEELACYTLEQVFHRTPIIQELQAWYVYINLLKKFGNYPALSEICEITNRELSKDESVILLETGIYLLKVADEEEQAAELVGKWIEGQSLNSLALEAFKHFKGQPSESYREVSLRLSNAARERKSKDETVKPQQLQGYIYTYRRDRNFGFLRDLSGNKYFFHRTAIVDEAMLGMLDKLTSSSKIHVVFEATQGPKNPIAIQISLYRTIDQLFELATGYANDGEYPKAIAQIKRVLALDPDYPNAQALHEKWREFARATGVPRGSNPYARAKRVQLIEKDLQRAVNLLREAIRRNDNTEAAIKDLATLLVQLGRTQEAIDVLEQNRQKVKDQQSLDNLFVSIYQKAGQYKEAIALLQKNLDSASSEEKKAQILWQIANSYLRQEDYKGAEQILKQFLKLRQDNIPAQRNMALCLSKQGRYDEAEAILNQILNTSPDATAAELLEAITRTKTTGKSVQVDEIIIETTLSDFSGELSAFTQFFLKRCNFEGVDPNRVKDDESGKRKYSGSEKDARYDIERLEGIAKQFGTRRPRDRANYYLIAARISLDIEGSRDLFYRYLCRSFASRGDAAVIENRNLDTAREWYCEALRIYDGCRQQDEQREKYDEQDAVNALSRFLFSYLGRNEIPTSPPEQDERESILKQQLQYIDNTVEAVISKHPQRDKVFDAIGYLVLHSRYAANRMLNCLYAKSTLQAMALEHLKGKGISIPGSMTRLDDFVHLWNELRRKKFDEVHTVSSELQFLTNVELTTAWLQSSIERSKSISQSLFFDLDQQRVRQLQRILETALELCKQVTFEEQERLCIQIDSRCQDLLKEIETTPTKLSVEQIYLVIEVIQKKVKERLQELYETSKPQPTLRLAYESYVPDNNHQIVVQIVVENKIGRSPAESLELVIQEEEDFFTVNTAEIKLDESLRGGEQRIMRVPLRVTQQALQSQTFSLALYAQYRTRSEEIEQTPIASFSIRLYPEEEFENIENPYAIYAKGGIVGDPEMFVGRDELIQNIARTIQQSRSQSKCVMVFGQKRAGKSSILYHLKRKMERDKNLLILDLGNIGSLLDERSSVPFLYQILWTILRKLEDAIEDRVEDGFSRLNLSFPSDREFYAHPSSLVMFKELFDKYKRLGSKTEGWRNIRIVILIDEFSYIYSQIVAGRIPESFMKNWKALLQENYFNAVLAGQDVMPKFRDRFPNEFGTVKEEPVTYLKREDAIKLIDEPIRIGGRQGESRYRERAIERILDFTAGNPFYIQIICNQLVEYMNDKHARLVTEADVEQVKNDLIRNYLGQYDFENLYNSGDTSQDAITDEDALKVLKAIAINSRTGPCPRSSIVCETCSPIDIVLDDLAKRGVIERERDHYYQIRVGLFKEWLIVHQ